jgi:hypothetical protein
MDIEEMMQCLLAKMEANTKAVQENQAKSDADRKADKEMLTEIKADKEEMLAEVKADRKADKEEMLVSIKADEEMTARMDAK